MKTLCIVLVGCCATALSAGAQSIPPEQRTRFDLPDTSRFSATERTIMRIELSRSPAIARYDTATLKTIYASDFKGVTAAGTQVDRNQLLQVFARDDGSTHFLIDQIEMKAVGTAIVFSGRLSTYDTSDKLLGRSVYMHVYAFRSKRWQIVRAQGTAQRLVEPPSTSSSDSAAIRSAIERGARGFMNANPDSILAHYDRSIVLSYPGIPDSNYETLVNGYNELRSRPANVVATTTPTFDEIMVAKDIAVVRLRWTTTIKTDSTAQTRYLRDLQVWQKNPQGEWRFIRGMHYRDSTAAP